MLHILLRPDFPFNPKCFPYFYGWVILIVSTVGLLMSLPGQTIGVSVFTDYLIEALGLSRLEISTAYMLGTITSSLLLPISGFIYDRVGARAMSVACLAALAGSLVYISQCDRIAQWLSPGGETYAWIAFAAIYLGFMLLRFTGQGLLAMSCRAMLGKWFRRRRGLVSGLNGMFATFFFSLAPLGLNAFIIGFNWRGAWLMMAAILLAMAGVAWLTFRDNPEECGLVMDGTDPTGSLADQDAKIPPLPPEREFTLGEALRTYTFWVFNLGLSAVALVTTAVTFHIVSIGELSGLTRNEALFIFFPMALFSIGMNFLFGWLSDRFALKYMLMLMLFGLSIGAYGVFEFHSPAGRWMMILGFGVGQGVFAPLMTMIWPTFFGRAHLGAISSFNLSCQVFGSAVGPFLFGLSYEWLGNYQLGLMICFALPLGILLSAGRAENPQEGLYERTAFAK